VEHRESNVIDLMSQLQDQTKKVSRAKGRLRVLVIDDSEVDLLAMSEMLEEAGFEVATLPSPIGATRRARDLNADAVVIDQNLPGMHGTRLAGLFRDHATLSHIKVVLVSSNEDVGRLVQASKVDAFVAKREIQELVRTLLLLCDC
jgi:PleD family two-component response regulator